VLYAPSISPSLIWQFYRHKVSSFSLYNFLRRLSTSTLSFQKTFIIFPETSRYWRDFRSFFSLGFEHFRLVIAYLYDAVSTDNTVRSRMKYGRTCNEKIISIELRFKDFTGMKVWVVTPCCLVGGYYRFGRTYLLHVLGREDENRIWQSNLDWCVTY
jgi:hypothetical protein